MTVLSCGYTQAQDETFEPSFIDSNRVYVLHYWRAILLIEDAYKKRIQDTLIDSLETRVNLLTRETIAIKASYVQEIAIEQAKSIKQQELITYEGSLKEYYKTQAVRYRRQRNWLIGGIGLAAAFGIAKVFVPP